MNNIPEWIRPSAVRTFPGTARRLCTSGAGGDGHDVSQDWPPGFSAEDKAHGKSFRPEDGDEKREGDRFNIDSDMDGRRSRYADGGGYEQFDEGMEEYLHPDVEQFMENANLPDLKDPFDRRRRFHRCPGKRQGKAGLEGSCEIFNVKDLHHNNIPLLQTFLNDAAMIKPRDMTGLCSKCQRKVATTVKRGRQLGVLPTVSAFAIRDSGLGAPPRTMRPPLGKAKKRYEQGNEARVPRRLGSLV